MTESEMNQATVPCRGLTLWRPWPWAIFHRGKPVENRPWAPPPAARGQVIALHAGQSWDDGGARAIAEAVGRSPVGCPGAAEHPTGIVGIARVVGVARIVSHDGYRYLEIDRYGKGKRMATRQESERVEPWFSGPYGWVLEDVVELPEPVPCRGFQGLWRIPVSARERLAEQLREAINRGRRQ